jgi:predicted dithiol-disulfide oxidoreductase (DUF899 family)
MTGADDDQAQRDALLAAENALIEQREQVAQLRRELPPGPVVDKDYCFREGPQDLVDNDPDHYFGTHLSALFTGERDTLIVQHLMFSPDSDAACPMCSMWADGFNAVVRHVEQRTSFVVIAKTQLDKLRTWGQDRGWDRLRLLSSYDNSFNADFGVELAPDRQLPALSAFRCGSDGSIMHCYTTVGSLVERHHRAMDLFTPVWNLLDLLPEGRGDWMPSHDYEANDA